MNYEFTKLGAVEALTEMPENANALVEVDGAIKRVPAGALGTPAPVVILPETELTGEGGRYTLHKPPENVPISGSNYKIVWDGVEYVSPALDVTEIMGEGTPVFAFGNSAIAFGEEGAAEIGNPVPGAPYFLMLLPDGQVIDEGELPTYGGMNVTTEEPTVPVLSIVEAAKTESAGGGAFVVTFTSGGSGSGSSTGFTYDDVTCDKNGDDIIAAHEAGIPIVGRFTYSAVEYVLHLVSVNGVMLDFASVVTSFNDMGGVFNDTISIMLIRMSGTNVTCAQHKKIL